MIEMDPIAMWKCKNGHVMGQVVRNGSKVRQLLLYRDALDQDSLDIQVVDVIAVVEGYCADVRCSVCGNVRTWVPGAEAMRQLLAHYQVEQVAA
jgi:hypothetical protein